MSKSISKLTGTNKVKFDNSAANAYINYLNNYDTSKVDNTIGNMENAALNFSNQLGNMGNYNFSVDASDAARQRAEQATYQAFLDKMTPQFETQTSDLQNRLINQGLTPGSEAYQRAMSDLQEEQNAATNQAAYQAVLQGQNAFTDSLNNSINAANFGNNSQQAYINLINSLLGNSVSGYENQQNIYSAGMGKAMNEYNARQQAANNRLSILNSAITGAAQAFGQASGSKKTGA